MISFIVPAYNEQACLGRTLQAIHGAACAVGRPYEIIVADDASTDATAQLARQHNATVLTVHHRQIAATRNSGARAAKGERLFFVDADTTINSRAVAGALRWMDKGAVGGGAAVWFEGVLPPYIRLLTFLGGIASKMMGFTGGAFMFCTREAFQATGGFDERLYWSEEGLFTLALKREGRFVVLGERVVTSARRFRTLSGSQGLAFLAHLAFSPIKTFTQRSSVEKIWYVTNRGNDERRGNRLAVQVYNVIGLTIITALLTGPIWDFIPWSLTPLGSPLGKIRFVVAVFLCHLGLICWPIAIVLLVNLMRQKRWTGLIQSAALIGFFLWQAWECTRGVIWIWTLFCRWLA